ncbi:Trip12 protein [Hyaloraphidium curvatum]|nr:Trip12 protein [Hyaloraphidium curvatum]
MVQNRLEPVPARSDIELHPGVIAALPPSAFVNSKVTAKLARQLDEPLIVAGRVVPDWCSAIARHFSFLVSFESRWTFLQSTSFGYSRSMLRWQQQQQQQASSSGSAAAAREQQVLGRIQRQKVRISRNRVLESMIKVMELYGSSQALLEVEFFEEVGTGLGPTLEFYTLVCTEIQKAKLKLWRDESTEPQPAKGSRRKSKPGADSDRYVVAPHGLFPAPMNAAVAASDNGKRLLNLFRNLGTFVAKSLLDARMVDIPFNNVFLRLILKGCFSMASASDEDAARDSEQQRVRGLHYLKHIDPALTQSLLHLQKYVHQKRAIESRRDLSADEILDQINAIKVDGAHVEDLCLDFSLPGYPDIELLRNGKNISVTIFNIEEYVAAVIEATLGDGVRRQVEAFRSGFDVVFPVTDLNAFTLEELGMLLGGGQQEDWSAEGLTDAIKADHGYRTDSIAIRNLIEILSEFTSLERREFLQFVTGSPKLPLGGFRNLSPPLTVVCKTCEAPHQPDDYLPSVMTCVNYLKMPDYSAKAVMKAKLLLAMSEGKGAFHLS